MANSSEDKYYAMIIVMTSGDEHTSSVVEVSKEEYDKLKSCDHQDEGFVEAPNIEEELQEKLFEKTPLPNTIRLLYY
jgi:hypothetical protein